MMIHSYEDNEQEEDYDEEWLKVKVEDQDPCEVPEDPVHGPMAAVNDL